MLEGQAPKQEKGWVRGAILLLLSASPLHPSEIADRLGVSRATVSYHLKELAKRGVVEMTDVRTLKGSVHTKTYGITRGGVLVASPSQKAHELGRPFEKLGELKMKWPGLASSGKSLELKLLLYQIFISAHALSLHAKLDEFEKYGRRVGMELVAEEVGRSSLSQTLARTARWLSANNMANCSLEELEPGSTMGLQCLTCFDSRDYGGPVCSFTQGLISGAIEKRRGDRYTLERVDEGATGCHFQLKRNRLRSSGEA